MPTPPLPLLLNDFAIRCFRDTADRDYVSARLAYRHKLVPQFQWSSLHCLEKYAKCILLLNRVPATKTGHEVTSLLETLRKEGNFEVPLSPATQKFIARLEPGAQYRYFEVSYFGEEFDVLRLDRAVWEIRRYCQPLDPATYEDLPNANRQLELNLDQVREALAKGDKGTCVVAGWLEQVVAKARHPARAALVWNNLHFGPSKRKSIRMVPYMEGANSPLDMYPEQLEEVLKYVKVPARIVKEWRAELATRRPSK